MRSALVLALAFAPTLAWADIIHLADGTTRQGRVIETTDDELVVDFGRGSISLVTRIPRAKVVRIERKASPNEVLMTDYTARLARAIEGGADDWHVLGVWCAEQRCLNDKARQAFQRAIALAPDHVGAHTALGHVKLNDTWMSPGRALAILAPKVAHGTEAKERELAARREAEEAKARLLEVQKDLEQLKARVAELKSQNNLLIQRLSVPSPPPPRPRVVYRPVIIYRDRPHPRRADGGKRNPQGNKGK